MDKLTSLEPTELQDEEPEYEWDETEDIEDEDDDPFLDPAFASWEDFYRYMYG